MARPLLLSILLLFTTICFPSCGKSSARIPVDKPFFNSKFIEIDKMMLHYRIWPAAISADTLPWILMVHGMAGSTWSWEKNAPALAAEGWNVVAVDVPPFGYSGKDPNFSQSADNRAALLWKFLNRINPDKKWNLIGHSMGGGIVQVMAILNPEKVDKVVFVDPALFGSPGGKTRNGPALLKFRPFEWIATGLGKAFLIRKVKIRKLLRSAYAAEPDPIDVEEYYKALRQPGFARAFIRSSPQSKPLTTDGTKFSKPALAIWGDKDTWVPLEGMRPLINLMPTVRLRVIEGAGHCPMATHSVIFNEEVLRFLK